MQKQKLLCLWICAIAVTSCTSSKTPGRDRCYVVDEKYVHKYGLEVGSTDWKARGQNGKVISTLDNGVVVTQMYESGTLEGETTYTFPHSNTIEKTEIYKNGELVKTILNDDAGIPKKEMEHLPEGQQIISEWYSDGTPQCWEKYQDSYLVEGNYYNSSNKVEQRIDNGSGTRIVRDRYGDIISTDNYESGVLVSKTTYHKNGSPKAITPYRNNICEGTRRTFLPAGEPEALEQWVGGIQQGETIEFKNGEKYAEIPFQNGKKNGIEKRYRDGKTLIEEISWRDNVRHGPSDTFVNGKVTKTEWYINGQKVSKSTWDLNSHKKIY